MGLLSRIKNNKKESFRSPASGKAVRLDNVNDEVFSQKIMGDGFAIIPEEGSVYAPLSGEITVCFPTKHAYGIKTYSGEEVLLHLGINTVELNGEGFKSLVNQGDKIKQGDKLCEMNISQIEGKAYDSTIMVIFTSGENIKLLKENMNISFEEEDIIEIQK